MMLAVAKSIVHWYARQVLAVPYMYVLLCVLHLCVIKDDDDSRKTVDILQTEH